MNSRRPTLKDVAGAARVHYSTVSLALRDHPSIPARTRARIRRVAEKLGYIANPAMAALSRFRTQSRVRFVTPRIAYLLNQTPEVVGELPARHQHFLNGARRQARTLGFDLETMFVTEDHLDAERLGLELHTGAVQGIIIGAFEPGYAGVALDWDRFAVVKIDSQHLPLEAVCVSSDQLHNARLAVQRLTALGYRRIGLAVYRAEEDATNQRHVAGWLIEQEAWPAEFRVPPLLFPYNASAEAASGLLGRWIARHQVDAVLCSWPSVVDLLHRANLTVPEQVACACLRLIDADGRIAGVAPRLEVVGAKAVSLLAAQMRAGRLGFSSFASATYVEGSWHDGATAPPRT